jgi:hypothetical protein
LPDERARLAGLAGVQALEERRARSYRLVLADGDDRVVIAALRLLLDAGIAPRSVGSGNSLEEFFLSVTGGDAEA